MRALFSTLQKIVIIVIFSALGLLRDVLRQLRDRTWGSPYARGKVIQTPESRFQGLPGYSFTPRFIQLTWRKSTLNMHYIDEGPSDAEEVVLCLHGEPAWSYLYRHVVTSLTADSMRIICPDFIGFGRSDKFEHPDDFSHELNRFCIMQLFELLNLDNVTLVVQDWGGLTGLSVLKDLPAHRVARIVIMNTGLPPRGRTPFRFKLNFLLWRSAAKCFSRSLDIERLFREGCRGLSEAEARAYAAPFPSRQYKAAVAKWPLMVPLTKEGEIAQDLMRAADFLRTWRKPALILFSNKCPITRGQDKFFEHLISTCGMGPGQTPRIVIEGAGHFLQEDKGEEIAANIVAFIENTPLSYDDDGSYSFHT